MGGRNAILIGAVGFAAGAASAQHGVQRLQRLDSRIDVSPVATAPATLGPGGVQRLDEWTPSARGPVNGEPVFDCYGDGDNGCGLSESRWFFGTLYCNPFTTNDMTLPAGVDRDAGAYALDLAWYWTCSGSGTERCIIGVFTQESDPNLCEPDSFDYPGWLLDFGELACNSGSYYTASVDISSMGVWTLPDSETGSYGIQFFQDGGFLATCAQSMLWGTGDATGDPCLPGTQGPGQFDDDNPTDGTHSTTECYTYSFGLCPDPLGAMIRFWGQFLAPCDLNADGAVNTLDVVGFLGLWAESSGGADSNGDGIVDTRDVLHYLERWQCCRT